MRPLRGVPRELWGRGRPPLAVRTPIALGPEPQIPGPSQNGEVSEGEGLIYPVHVCNLAATLATPGPLKRTFYRDRTLPPGVLSISRTRTSGISTAMVIWAFLAFPPYLF